VLAVRLALAAMAVDHGIGLVEQPLALFDTGPQLTLVLLQLARLPVASLGAILFLLDGKYLLPPRTTPDAGY
jgi:hypothetical protein